LYTIILVAVTALPFATQMSGWFYFIGAMILGGIFLTYAIKLQLGKDERIAIKTFGYSILYLMLLFALLLVDHYVPLVLRLIA
ncbi:MAG: protoheme IX farnesyltransferase, partial [Halobacteria archaeon]|nr:protoheme IX farnesyltransferase [Halobacteria archaeon]